MLLGSSLAKRPSRVGEDAEVEVLLSLLDRAATVMFLLGDFRWSEALRLLEQRPSNDVLRHLWDEVAAPMRRIRDCELGFYGMSYLSNAGALRTAYAQVAAVVNQATNVLHAVLGRVGQHTRVEQLNAAAADYLALLDDLGGLAECRLAMISLVHEIEKKRRPPAAPAAADHIALRHRATMRHPALVLVRDNVLTELWLLSLACRNHGDLAALRSIDAAVNLYQAAGALARWRRRFSERERVELGHDDQLPRRRGAAGGAAGTAAAAAAAAAGLASAGSAGSEEGGIDLLDDQAQPEHDEGEAATLDGTRRAALEAEARSLDLARAPAAPLARLASAQSLRRAESHAQLPGAQNLPPLVAWLEATFEVQRHKAQLFFSRALRAAAAELGPATRPSKMDPRHSIELFLQPKFDGVSFTLVHNPTGLSEPPPVVDTLYQSGSQAAATRPSGVRSFQALYVHPPSFWDEQAELASAGGADRPLLPHLWATVVSMISSADLADVKPEHFPASDSSYFVRAVDAVPQQEPRARIFIVYIHRGKPAGAELGRIDDFLNDIVHRLAWPAAPGGGGSSGGSGGGGK